MSQFSQLSFTGSKATLNTLTITINIIHMEIVKMLEKQRTCHLILSSQNQNAQIISVCEVFVRKLISNHISNSSQELLIALHICCLKYKQYVHTHTLITHNSVAQITDKQEDYKQTEEEGRCDEENLSCPLTVTALVRSEGIMFRFSMKPNVQPTSVCSL